MPLQCHFVFQGGCLRGKRSEILGWLAQRSVGLKLRLGSTVAPCSAHGITKLWNRGLASMPARSGDVSDSEPNANMPMPEGILKELGRNHFKETLYKEYGAFERDSRKALSLLADTEIYKKKPRLLRRVQRITSLSGDGQSSLNEFSRSIALNLFLQIPTLAHAIPDEQPLVQLYKYVRRALFGEKPSGADFALKMKGPLRLIFGYKDNMNISVQSFMNPEDLIQRYGPCFPDNHSYWGCTGKPVLRLQWYEMDLLYILDDVNIDNNLPSLLHVARLLEGLLKEDVVVATVRVDRSLFSDKNEYNTSVSKHVLRELEARVPFWKDENCKLFYRRPYLDNGDGDSTKSVFILWREESDFNVPFPYQAEMRSWKGTFDKALRYNKNEPRTG
eukprot:Nk52_evm4s16 gene=Nk52_evmTU4s16